MSERKYLTIEETFTDFFTVYKAHKQEHFTAIFGDVSDYEVTALDNLLIDVFGERVITKNLEKSFSEEGQETATVRAINAVDLLCYDNWLTLKANLAKMSDFDIEKPYADIAEKTVERVGEQATQNKENAFDDTENASDTTASNENHSESVTETVARHYSGNKTAIETACSLIDFTKNNDYVKIVLTDIADTMTVKIY